MKRFWLFAGQGWRRDGIFESLKGTFDTHEGAVKATDEYDSLDWWEIVDTQAECVEEALVASHY